ncbi:hypothetical protein GDO78_006287 [Eleutherodactylus coqui]|uniref:Uncharacterized protein n=1 Tax=Eleutherodactylus coqui TaxID=57060 RepID=A0A8J6FN37_ELECQ|nr:hypothetical protein GDO78_006287 [Eleutherodactylus coqui]
MVCSVFWVFASSSVSLWVLSVICDSAEFMDLCRVSSLLSNSGRSIFETSRATIVACAISVRLSVGVSVACGDCVSIASMLWSGALGARGGVFFRGDVCCWVFLPSFSLMFLMGLFFCFPPVFVLSASGWRVALVEVPTVRSFRYLSMFWFFHSQLLCGFCARTSSLFIYFLFPFFPNLFCFVAVFSFVDVAFPLITILSFLVV